MLSIYSFFKIIYSFRLISFVSCNLKPAILGCSWGITLLHILDLQTLIHTIQHLLLLDAIQVELRMGFHHLARATSVLSHPDGWYSAIKVLAFWYTLLHLNSAMSIRVCFSSAVPSRSHQRGYFAKLAIHVYSFPCFALFCTSSSLILLESTFVKGNRIRIIIVRLNLIIAHCLLSMTVSSVQQKILNFQFSQNPAYFFRENTFRIMKIRCIAKF